MTLTLGKDGKKVIRIGKLVDPAKPEGGRYAAVEGWVPTWQLGNSARNSPRSLLAPPVAFRDHSLAKFADADRAVLQRGDRKIAFAKKGGNWKVAEPLQVEAESAGLSELIARLSELRPTRSWLRKLAT